jgi:hypothetical protein
MRREGMSITLTVFFENPYWVGLFTISEDGKSRYCKVTFGKEPSDAELYEFCLKKLAHLEFSDSYQTGIEKTSATNPKRRQREIAKELQGRSSIKKSYEAVKEFIHQNEKKARQKERKKKVIEDSEHIFLAKQQKHKEKHRGH